MVFDGEVMSDDFQSLMKQVHRKTNAKTEDAYLALFDILPLEEFNDGKSRLSTLERKYHLEKFTKKFPPCIKIVEYTVVNFDEKKVEETYSEMNTEALKQGYEGLMIKPENDLYECKRSHAWLKMKPYIEVTLKVTEVHEGTGRHAGKLGAFSVEGTDDGKFFSLNVGSGLTDENREKFWQYKDALIGQLIEIRADAVTKSM